MDFRDLVNMFIDYGLRLIPLLGVIAFLVFVFGVGKFIRGSGNEAEVKKNKAILIWGTIGLAVLFSLWGLVAWLRGEFGWSGDPLIPQFRTDYSRSQFNP